MEGPSRLLTNWGWTSWARPHWSQASGQEPTLAFRLSRANQTRPWAAPSPRSRRQWRHGRACSISSRRHQPPPNDAADSTNPNLMTDRLQYVNPDVMHPPTGYTHVVDVQPGRVAYIPGQVALNKAGQLVGEGDICAKTR